MLADTSRLNILTDYIIKELSREMELSLKKKKVPVGKQSVMKQFAGVSDDRNTVIHVCHHSGLTSSGNIPVGKINGLFAKCFLMEKVNAENKYIYFSNKEFFEIFRKQSDGLLDDSVQLRYFDGLPEEMIRILEDVIGKARVEMV